MEPHKTLDSIDAVVDSKKPLAAKITAFLLHWGVETHGYGYNPTSSCFNSDMPWWDTTEFRQY
jgi:hypothetical protein